MSKVEEPITPMRRVTIVLGAFVLGCAAAAVLRDWWSARCGENCPSPNVVHMLVFLGLLPTASAMSAVLLVSTSWTRRIKLRVAVGLLLLAVVIGVVVARIPMP